MYIVKVQSSVSRFSARWTAVAQKNWEAASAGRLPPITATRRARTWRKPTLSTLRQRARSREGAKRGQDSGHGDRPCLYDVPMILDGTEYKVNWIIVATI